MFLNSESIFEKAVRIVETHRKKKRKTIFITHNADKQLFSLTANLYIGTPPKLPIEQEGMFFWFFPETQTFCLQQTWKADAFQENVRLKYLEFLRLVRRYDKRLFR